MLHSMTGFVSHEVDIHDLHVTWEVKTLNHRFIDMTFKLPEAVRCLEFDFRNIAKQYIKRGKFDVSLYIRSRSLKDSLKLSDERLQEIITTFTEAKQKFVAAGFAEDSIKVSLTDLFACSSFNCGDQRNLCDNFKAQLVTSFYEVMKKLEQARVDEGKRLEDALVGSLCSMKQITAEICTYAKTTKDVAYRRLQNKVLELCSNANVDPIRLEQEVLLLAQKADIQEELDRLNSHFCEISSLLSSKDSVGRKLDFLMQELNRESNTICSKSTDINIINSAISLKTHIEQMREQIQNIE